MALRRFIKLPKHQQYRYKPRYWDPEKDELKERMERIESLKKGDTEGMKARIASGMKRGYMADSRARNKQMTRSNLVLLFIVIFLLGASYVFMTVYLPEIINKIEGVG
ncbi:MAG TPA: hypothetical protein VJ953_17615 [Saprospiraceae bacterium]|nr:hypothetical protein [Saprospiraceae bacterium]